jgi:hypothetical protein
MRTLDILYVGTLPPHPGGSAISGYQRLGCLARLGHAVRILAPTTPSARARSAAFDRTHAELDTTRFDVPHFEVPPCFPYPRDCVRLEAARHDLARLGEMMRLDGRCNGQQIVPRAVVHAIRRGSSKEHFAKAGFALLPQRAHRLQLFPSPGPAG